MKGQNCNRQILQEMRFLLVEVGLRAFNYRCSLKLEKVYE